MSEQEAVFSKISRRSDVSSGPVKIGSDEKAQEMWHSITGRKKGLLVDTGAVKPLTGGAFVRSQIADMEAKGFQAIWTALAQPEFMRGVGRGSQKCSWKVDLVGALHTGELISYQAPVLDSEPDDPGADGVPPLYGLCQLGELNSLFNSRTGELICLPEGESVSYPAGTRILQCEKAPGGHWLLGVDHWSKVPSEVADRVRSLRMASRSGSLG